MIPAGDCREAKCYDRLRGGWPGLSELGIVVALPHSTPSLFSGGSRQGLAQVMRHPALTLTRARLRLYDRLPLRRITRADMPTADEFWSAASEVVSERGHLVIGFSEGSEQPELGSKLDNVLGFKPARPIMIVGPSDWSDWKEQVETFYRLRPTWGRGKSGDPNGKYYSVRFGELRILNSEVVPSVRSSDSLPSAVPSFSGYAVQAVPEGLTGEPFWPRAVARIVDYVLLNLVIARFAGLLFRFLLTTAAGGRPPLWVLVRFSQHRLPLFFASLCGYFAYQTICTSIHGSTLGKRLLSLQVVQDDGSPCRPRSAMIRELAFFVDSFFFGLIGYTAMRANDQHKRYGDWWADTIVRKIAKAPHESRHEAGRFMLGLTLGVMADVVFVIAGLLIMMSY